MFEAIHPVPGAWADRHARCDPVRPGLRKIAEDDVSNLGDISTLADPAVEDTLLANRSRRAAA